MLLNHYQVLSVASTAATSEIRKAYYSLARENHPDKTSTLALQERGRREKLFKDASHAWEVLSDDSKRRNYDKTLAATVPKAKTSSSQSQAARQPRASNANPSSHSPSQPTVHRFTTGSPAGTCGSPSEPWFHCPVSETPEMTTMLYTSWVGWSFAVNVSKRFTLVAPPSLPQQQEDTTSMIQITLRMERNKRFFKGFSTKEAMVRVNQTPGKTHVLMASLFKDFGRAVELKVTLTRSPDQSFRKRVSWTFAFDADHCFLVNFRREVKATQLLFYSTYPAHVFPRRQPRRDSPEGSPEAQLMTEEPRVTFRDVSDHHYYQEIFSKGMVFHQLLAVGHIADGPDIKPEAGAGATDDMMDCS